MNDQPAINQCLALIQDQKLREEAYLELKALQEERLYIRDQLIRGYKSNPWAVIRSLCKKCFSCDVTT